MSAELPPGAPAQGQPWGELPPACAAVDEDLAELALGALTGRRRVLALAHLEQCPRCTAVADELSAAADQLLHLAPEAEPPAGFEAHLFQRLGILQRPTSRRSRWSRLRISALACAAGVVVVLAFGVGALVGRGNGGSSDKPPIQLASLVSHGHPMGRVYVYAGNPTWLFMVIYGSNWDGTLRCEVTLDDGPPMVLGKFWLSDGKGAWSESISVPAGRLRQARVLDAHGQVLATANLSVT
ncbi:MAG TPA: hypothetical protein VME20_04970 [Acidimicrobiales bacterium]|nr:hypothetical protein [Acidimicrobiales bacterium]